MSQVDYILIPRQGIPTNQPYRLNNRSVVRMGSNPQNDVCFPYADIAAFHIEIRWMGDHHELLVLQNVMETRLNQQVCQALMRVPLKNGDHIQLGHSIAFEYGIQVNYLTPNVPSNSSALVPSQFAYPVVQAPPVVRTPSLTPPLRIGCRFCLYTLDPNDPDERLRSFVKVDQYYYHQVCYDRLPAKPSDKPTVVTIQPIEPLPWRNLTPIMFNPSPANNLEVEPLGISVGTIILDQSRSSYFFIRNNSSQPISISRIRQPAWVYLQHYHPQIDDNFGYNLPPHETLPIMIVSHVVCPSFVAKEIRLSLVDYHVIDVISNARPIGFILAAILGGGIFILHLIVLVSWLLAEQAWTMLFLHMMVSVLMVWWLVYMAPGRLLEGGNQLFKWALRFNDGIARAIHQAIARRIASNRLFILLQNPIDYLGFALMIALGVVGGVYLPLFVLLTFFPPILRLVFSVGYVIILIAILDRIIYDYSHDDLYVSQRLWRFIVQLISRDQS